MTIDRAIEILKKTKLKPCPFCGGEAVYIIYKNYIRVTAHEWQFGIKCTNCMIELPMRDFIVTVDMNSNGEIVVTEDERGKAADMWNRRAEHE